jgi:hypothetical protein
MAYNYYQSYVTEITYTINPNLAQAATPTFSVAGGTYTTPQTVTISDATKDATIFYSTDGTAPAVPYSNPITIANSETLQAIAVAGTYANSGIASATYTINGPPPDFTVAASPASLSMKPGQSGTAVISVTSLNGFDSMISFACSGLPSGASCSFSPANVTPSGAGASTTLTVTASTTTAALRRNSNSLFSGSVLAAALAFFSWKRRRSQMLWLLALSVAGLTLLSGCGSKGSPTGGAPATPQPTASTITVTATSGSLQHATSLSLTVN